MLTGRPRQLRTGARRMTDDVTPSVVCPGCGALVLAADGPTHPYYDKAPGCWALYGEVLAREYSDFRFGRVHHLTVDAYAAQHPGQPERRTIKSVAVHLIGLHLALERGVAPSVLMGARQAAAERSARSAGSSRRSRAVTSPCAKFTRLATTPRLTRLWCVRGPRACGRRGHRTMRKFASGRPLGERGGLALPFPHSF
jgi:hypothetical protein